MGFFRKKAVILIAAMITVFLLAGLTATGKYKIAFLESVLATALSPFEYGLFRITESVSWTTSFAGEIVSVYSENQSLKKENEKLRRDIISTDELLAENMRLRDLLEYKKTTAHFEFVAAQVIARDPGTWTNTITINRGSNDGIAKNTAAVNSQGLIGNVVSVYPNSAKIRLIIDPRSAVGTLVQRPGSRVAAIVEGNSSNPLHPRMVNLARDTDVLIGDRIITSGFGGIYPKGILVGEVAEIVNDDIGFLKYAVLNMAVDFNKLEEVLVIKGIRETAPLPAGKQTVTKEGAGR